MQIRMHSYQDGVTKLGPGKRFVLWTQGCPRRCKGCMTPTSQDTNGGYFKSVEELAQMIQESGRTGLTISGGEPFMQAEGLCELIDQVRTTTDIGVIIYTGYTLEEINSSGDEYMKQLLAKTDLLIDGPYIDELNDGRKLRGSSNQRAIPLTDRYIEDVGQYGAGKAEIELFMKENRIVMVGVPDKATLARFKKSFTED